jgi:hypothetical protein
MNEPLFLRSEDVEKLHTMAVYRFRVPKRGLSKFL